RGHASATSADQAWASGERTPTDITTITAPWPRRSLHSIPRPGRSPAVRATACGGQMNATDSQARLDAALDEVMSLLQRHRVLETWTHNQATRQREVVEALVHRQNVAELHQRLRALHPADLAYVVEALSPEDRALVWEQVTEAAAVQVLPELGRDIRGELMGLMSRQSLVGVLAKMDVADLAYVSDSIPPDLLEAVYQGRDAQERSWVETVASYPEDSVGRLMLQDYVAVPDASTVADTLARIRA